MILMCIFYGTVQVMSMLFELFSTVVKQKIYDSGKREEIINKNIL